MEGMDHTVTHSRPAYGSRMSISQLPSLPEPSIGHIASDDEQSDPETTTADHTASFIEIDLSKKSPETNRFQSKVYTAESFDSIIEKGEPPERPEPRKHVNETKDQKIKRHEDDFFNDDTAAWKSMKTVAEDNYYNDRGGLEYAIGSQDDYFDPKNTNGGYTRISTAEQLAKYAELDKKTDFLFISTKEVEAKTAKYREHDEQEDDDDYLYEEQDALETDEALQSTKEMLSENQKFSYVGIVRLITVDMATELAKIKQSTGPRVAKQLSASQKNFANWSLYITGKIYEHLDLSIEEQRMIENLSIHGLDVQDLTSSLVSTPTKTSTNIVDFSLEWVLICDLFILLLSDGYYDARSRSLLMKFAKALGIEDIEIFQFERRLLNSLELETKDKSLEDNEEMLNDTKVIQKYKKKNKKKRLAYIGLATIGGTLAIGLSAGLLAPVIGAGLAAGLTTVGIGGTSGFLAGVGGSTLITTGGIALGASVGNKAGRRRAGEVETFELKPLHDNKRANLIITVSGWMTGKSDDVRLPFSTIDPVMGDLFSVIWEPEMLKSMGQTIGILASEALTSSIQQILGATILSSLMAAIQIPLILSKLSYLVDNPWNVSLDRAWKAGKIMADTLISGNLGVRPITLVGFSLGARVVYSCLIELSQKGCFGLVENVILLGCPIAVNKDQLGLARSVVSGRFINGYSRKDWVLGYLFRATGGGILSVAGLSPINDSYGVENLDCTHLVEGHMAYRKAIPKILQELDWEILDEQFAEIEEPDSEEGERQRQLIIEFDEARARMKKELEEEDLQVKEKKGWKRFFTPKQNNWWKDIGEAPEEKPAEYDETDNPTPIFDVEALRKEAEEIERAVQPEIPQSSPESHQPPP